MNVVNGVLLVVILTLVIYCVVKQKEDWEPLGATRTDDGQMSNTTMPLSSRELEAWKRYAEEVRDRAKAGGVEEDQGYSFAEFKDRLRRQRGGGTRFSTEDTGGPWSRRGSR